jgi:cell division protein FtsW
MMEQESKKGQERKVQGVPSILSKRKLLPGDRVLWVIVVLFFSISLVAVYTASSQLGFREGTIDVELQRHFTTLCISGGILFSCYLIGASTMLRSTLFIYSFALFLTIAPYFIGGTTNNAHRWLDLGFFRFQPSELLKIGTIMLLAAQLSARHNSIKSLHLVPTTINIRKWKTPREHDIIKNEVLPVVLPIFLSCVVILPAHSSSAIHIFLVSLLLLFIAGIRFKEIAKLTITALFFGVIMLFTVGRGDTVANRLKSWGGKESVDSNGNKEGGKDAYYSRMAIQNGGIFGVGAGRSIMRTNLMHPESDYLFAIVVEEFGLLLASVIILLYLWIFFRALRIFERCEWLYPGLIVVGLALLVTSQGFLHIGVTLGILPETGQNLPFLTHGRTGMFCASIAVGLILSISRQVEQGTLTPPTTKKSKNRLL